MSLPDQTKTMKINEERNVKRIEIVKKLEKLHIAVGQGKLVSLEDNGDYLLLFKCTNKNCQYRQFATEILDYFLSITPDMIESRSEYVNFMKLFHLLRYFPDKKPKQLSEYEKVFIQKHRQESNETETFTIREIAKMLCRSTSTIHEAIQKEDY